MYLDKCCITELPDKPGLVQIDGVCPHCQEPWKLCLSEKQIFRYMQGEDYASNIFPNLPAHQIELLVTGVCKSCIQPKCDAP